MSYTQEREGGKGCGSGVDDLVGTNERCVVEGDSIGGVKASRTERRGPQV